MKKNNFGISVFMPAFNEEESIEKAICDIYDYLKKNFLKFEVVVINDGSKDKTRDIVEKNIKNKKNVRLINHSNNLGYGAVIRSGIKNAKYDLIFYTDSDNQFDINNLDLLMPFIKEYDIVSGFRKNRCDPLMRIIIAWVYNQLIRILFNLKIKDVDCSFKLYKKHVFKNMKLYSNTGLIDAEILIKAQKEGFTIAQVGVKHYPRLKGKTSYVFGKQNAIFAFVKPQVILDIFREIKKLWKELH